MSMLDAQIPIRITSTDASSRPVATSQTIPHHVRIRNRRKRYLEAHPSYFGPSLESADPLLYDRLIRSHQTEAERTQERSAKGFAGTLEADLLRSEAKLDEVRERQSQARSQSTGQKQQTSSSATTTASTLSTTSYKHRGTTNGDTKTKENDPDSISGLLPLPPASHEYASLTRDEAQQYWIELMTKRFLDGEDEDFDYGVVDGDERWDDVRGEERDIEEDWFDGEEEKFVGASDEEGDGKEEKERSEGKGRILLGETGIQDF